MTTIVHIDNDVLILLRERSQRDGVPLAVLVNRLLRLGLQDSACGQQRPFRERPVSMGTATINPDKALAAASALEDEAVLKNVFLRK